MDGNNSEPPQKQRSKLHWKTMMMNDSAAAPTRYERIRDCFYGYLIGLFFGSAFAYGSYMHMEEKYPEVGFFKYPISLAVGVAFFFLCRKAKIKGKAK